MALQHYGIFAPVMGLREDMPSILIEDAWTPDCENVQLRWGEVHRAKMRNVILDQIAGGDPVIKYHWFIKTDGKYKLLAFTKDNIYGWSSTTEAWVSMLCVDASEPGHGEVGIGDCTEWSVVTFKDYVICTNNVDKVMYGDESAASFKFLDDADGLEYETGKEITKAKFVATFENYLFVGNVTAEGTASPHSLYWSSYGDKDDWLLLDSGSVVVEGDDHLTGAAQYRDFLIIFAKHSAHRMWLTTKDLVFEKAVISHEIGTEAPNSVVNGRGGELYFLANDMTFREIQLGEVSEPIDTTMKTHINPENVSTVVGQRMDIYGEIWWGIPYIGETIDQATNSRVVVFKPPSTWTWRDMPVSAMGVFKMSEETDTPADYIWMVQVGDELTDGVWNTSDKTLTSAAATFTTDVVAAGDIVSVIGGAEVLGVTSQHVVDSVDSETKVTCTTAPSAGEDDPENVIYAIVRPTTLASIGAHYVTWDDWNWDQWMSNEAITGYLTDIGGDYSGYTYRLHDSTKDNDTEFTAYFTLSTDLAKQQALAYHKRLTMMHLYFRTEGGGTVAIYIRRDTGSAWETASASLSLEGNGDFVIHDLPCDFRAKTFEVKISAANDFRFVGVVFDFMMLGMR